MSLRALVSCTDFLSGRTRMSLLLSCRTATLLLSAEAARLRDLRAHVRVLEPALKQLIPRHIQAKPVHRPWMDDGSWMLRRWMVGPGAPRDNENAFWAHASPRAQCPWWVKELSETLLTWPLCSAHACIYNSGCIGPYCFPDPHEHVPETFVRHFHTGPRMWDAQLRHAAAHGISEMAGNFKVSNLDHAGLIVDTYMVARELEDSYAEAWLGSDRGAQHHRPQRMGSQRMSSSSPSSPADGEPGLPSVP